MNEQELNQRMREACKPQFDTACMAEAVRMWNATESYNGEYVPYLSMTLEQRMWVTKKAQEIKEAL